MSTHGLDPVQDEVEALPLRDVALELENLLVSRGRGGAESPHRYAVLRQRLIDDLGRERVPEFVRTCRTLDQFWGHIKKLPSYAQRDSHVWEAFSVLIETIDSGTSPLDDAASESLEALDAEHVTREWKKALDRRSRDPEGAITSARSMLETVCKLILDDYGVAYGNDDLQQLYTKVAQAMQLSPSQHTEQAFKQVLNGCYSVVNGIAALRNRLSDSHGQGKKPVRPAAHQADLAVNLAGAMAIFLVETWEARGAEDSERGG